jgi:uncharacterized repeat protein (TIGR04052 family)
MTFVKNQTTQYLMAFALASFSFISSAQETKEIRFEAAINGAAFECGKSYSHVGLTQSMMTPNDFRMFISDVNLIEANGKLVPLELIQDNVWQVENVALIDFENGSDVCRNGTKPLNKTIKGSVPKGEYKGIQFVLGIPFKLNHGNPTVAPSPLSSTAMFWNWQGGYKFLKFDSSTNGRPIATQTPNAQGGGNASGFSVHLGSTVCASESKTTAPSSCKNPNVVTVRFDQFDVNQNVVVADMGAVLAQANIDINAEKTAPGCMSFPGDADCPPIMKAFGLPYEGQQGGDQVFFKVK